MTIDPLDRLLGLWRIDAKDSWSVDEYGDVSLQFEPSGRLVYTVHLKEKDQIMHLTYRVEGEVLVTDQPSSPREERTKFHFAADGRLALRGPGSPRDAFYVRA